MSIYTYDNTTIVLYSTEDEGLIGSSETDVDYGSISDAPTNLQAQSNLSNDDYGEISISDTNTPFGTVTLSGTKAEAWCPRRYLATGTATLASTALEGVRKIWAGNGSLFEMGGGMERSSAFWVGSGGRTISGSCVVTTTLDWNEDLFVTFTQEDLGFVVTSPDPLLDFGSISDVLTAGELDRGFVYNTGDVRGATSYHKLTNAPWAEFNTYSFTTDRTGSGGLFAASGLSETKTSTEFGDKTTLFSVTGGEIYSQTSREIMSGNVSFGSAGVEKYIQDYTKVTGFNLEIADYGTTTAQYLSEEDDGSIAEPRSGGEYDHGGIIWNNVEANTGTYQFVALYDIQGDGTYARYWEGEGSITLSGNSIGTTTQPHWTGGGSLFSTGGAAECRTDSVIGGETTLFNWSGSYSNLQFQYHWTGSGTLFETGGCSILRTFGYDDTATIGYSTDDWGHIDAPIGEFHDWGIADPYEGAFSENWWYIWHDGVANAMGGLKVQSDPKVLNDTPENYFQPENAGLNPSVGQNWNTYRFTWGRWLVQGGSLFSAGGAAEAAVFQPVEDTAIGTLSGTYSGLQATFREIGSGNISSFEGVAHTEKATFDYNDFVLAFSSEDYGDNLNVELQWDEWGSIVDPKTAGEVDRRLVVYGETVYSTTGGLTYGLTRVAWTQEEIDARLGVNPDYVTPETGYLPVAGQEKTQEESGDVRYKPIWGQNGQGSLFTARGAAECTTANPLNDTALFDIFTAPQYVGYTYRYAWSYVGEASIPAIGGAAESITFDYNEDSINVFVQEDEGLITQFNDARDYGDLGVLSGGEEDYDSIVWTSTTYPVTGTLQTSGVSPSAAVYRDPTQGGSLFSAGGAVESVTFDDYENIVLFTLTTAPQFVGNTYRFCWNAPEVTGGLFSVGGGVEKVAFDYSEDSIIPFSSTDNGLITDSAVDLIDQGSIVSPQSSGEDNYGSIVWTATATPFGSLYTGLVRDRWTQAEIDEKLYNNPLYKTPETDTVPVAGQEKTQEEAGHVQYKPIWGQNGSGSLYAIGGAAEAAVFNDTESTALFDLYTSPAGIGNTYRYAWSYNSYGNLPTVGGAAESATFDYNQSSINTYVVDDEGNIVDAATVFGDYDGLGALTQGEEDYGSTEFLVTTYPLTGLITLTTAPQFVGNTYRFIFRAPAGSGGLFAAGGAAETKTSTEFGDSTTLFDIYTSPAGVGNTYRFCWNFVGSGNIPTVVGGSECRTYDYNETSDNIWTGLDWGSVTDTAIHPTNDVFNYGSIADPLTAGEEDYQSVVWTSTAYALTGTYSTSGIGSDAVVFRDPTTGGSLFSAGGAAEAVAFDDSESTALFDLYTSPAGIGNTYRFCWNYTTTGGFRHLTKWAGEAVTWDYNESSIVTYTTDDYGLVSDSVTTTADYGDLGVVSDGEVDHGSVIWTSTAYPVTGVLQTSGTVGDAVVFRDPTAGGSLFSAGGAAEVVGFNDTESTALFDLFTAPAYIGNTYRFIWNAPPGSGGLFSIGGGVEKVTFDYNQDSGITFSSTDFGDITVNIPLTPNNPDVISYGSVDEIQYAGEESYGLIVYGADALAATGQLTFGLVRPSWTQEEIDAKLAIDEYYVTPETGVIPVVGDQKTQEESGHIKYVPIFAQIGEGSLYSIGGAAESKTSTEFGEDTSLGDLSGTAVRRIAVSEVGSGSLFSVGGCVEARTYDYNESASITFGTADWGSVTDATHPINDVFNYGSIVDPVTAGEEDYGTVIYTTAVDATTGTYAVSGIGSQTFTFGNFTGSGSLFTTSGAAERVTFNDYEDISLFDIYTAPQFIGNTYSFVWTAPPGTGGLFTIIDGAECRTYDYNEDTILPFNTVDYGSVTDATHPIDDAIEYGSVADPITAGVDDYGSVIYTDVVYPLTGTYTISGEAGLQHIMIPSHEGSGEIFTMGGAAETAAYVPSVSTVLYDIFTAPQFVGDTYRFCWNAPPVTGGLFSIGGCVESRTYDYNDSADVSFSSADYGLVSDAHNPISDAIEYGSIVDPTVDGEEDYESIIYTQAVNAAEGTYTVSGAGGQVFAFGVFSGTGSLFSTGGAGETKTSTEFGEDTALGDLSGVAHATRTRPFIGSGSIFKVGGAAECRTYDYNLSSIDYWSQEDNGSITDSATTLEDNGSITDPNSAGEQDNGQVHNWVGDRYGATGQYRIWGEVSDPLFIRAPYVGSGSLFVSSGAAEVATVDYENILLCTIITAPQFIGNTYSYSWSYECSGNINALSGAAESKTWVYDENLPHSLVVDDEGNIVDAATVFGDYGDLGVLTAGEEDYGNNNTLAHPGAPTSGTYTFGGEANTPFTWRGGCEGGTYTISGTAEERFARFTIAVGGGKWDLYTAPQFVNNTYAFTWGHGFVQSGSLFSAGGAAESTTTNPPETTLLYTVGGTKVEEVTVREIGSGSISLSGAATDIKKTDTFSGSGTVTLSGTGAESKSFGNFIGSGSLFTAGGAAETTSVSPESTGIGTLSGVAVERHTEVYVGSGTATISGEAEIRLARAPYEGSGSITLSGTKAESFTPATHIGSGSIFTIGGAAESITYDYEETYLFNVVGNAGLNITLHFYGSGSLFTAGGAAEAVGTNPPESTILFTAAGSGIEKHTENYVGSGSATVSGTSSTRYIPHITGSGTATFSGEADLIYRVRYFGSGSLFTAGGSAESVTTNPPESTVLLAPTGTVTESRVFGDNIGSGSITLSGAATDIKKTDAFAGSGTATISGAATFKLRYILTGSGNIFTTVGAAESTTSNPPEDTALFTWSGAGVDKWQPVWVGQGSYFTSGQIPEPLITKHWTASGSLFALSGAAESFSANIDGIGLYDISGIAQTPRARDFVGTGSLWTASGAAEAVGTNPPESTVLFEYAGAGTEKHVERWVGDSAQYTISGEVTDIQLTKHWTGSGSISLSGTAVERQTDDWVGSGSLFTAAGAAESTTTNPPENTVLYTWTGAGTEKHTERYVGDTAQYTTSGVADTRFTPNWNGSGGLFATAGTAESVSTSEVTTGLFTIYGDGDTSRTRPYVGSGSITLSGSSTESQTFIDQYLQTAHYSISGEATDIKLGYQAEGFGYTFLYTSIYSRTRFPLITKHWTGSGSLFTAGGAAESKTTNAPENTTLHKVTGEAIPVITLSFIGSGTATFSGDAGIRFVPNNIGSGTATVTGTAVERQTDDWEGSGTTTVSGDASFLRTFAHEGTGSLFTASGAAESKTVDWETYYLFEVQGTGAEAFVRKGYVGSGNFSDISGSVTDVKLTHNPPEDTAQYTYSGGVTDIKRTASWIAPHAALFAIGGTHESATVDYENIVLATIGGTAVEEFIRAGYIGQGTITLTGESLNELRTFEPEFVFAEII